MKKLWFLVGCLLLACNSVLPSESKAQAPLNDAPANSGDVAPPPGIDPSLLIKAKAAYELMKTKEPLFVDVRSRTEFNAEHIEGAISFPFTVIRDTDKYPFKKERKLILYCGCPHHLSGMSAEVLKGKGYQNIHVIDEGYWGWKALKLPVYVNPNAPKRMSMNVEGSVAQGNAPLAFADVFLLQPESGQLEATRTDAQGGFRMTLHFSGLKPQDRVILQWHGKALKKTTVAELQAQPELNVVIPKQPS